MKKINQKGFGSLTLLLAFIVAVIVVGIGIYVFRQQNPALENSTKVNFVNASDSSGSFNYHYPDNWVIKSYDWAEHGGSIGQKEPDWTKETQPITLISKENKAVTINIIEESYEYYGPNRSDGKSFDDLIAYVKEDNFAKTLFNGTREDGHKALFTRVDYLGPPDAKVESFTDHRYYFDNGKSLIRVDFREKYHHDWPDEETGPDIDNSKYLSDFEHIAKSIKFLN